MLAWRNIRPLLATRGLEFKSEHHAVMSLYPALRKVIKEAFWLADLLSGEVESNQFMRGSMSASDARDICVREAADALMICIADKRVRQLEPFRLEGLENCLVEFRTIRADEESWDTVARALYTEASKLSRYLLAILRHVFGLWGAHWFEYAVEMHTMAESARESEHLAAIDIGVLHGILERPPLVVEVEDMVGEPLRPLQKQILVALDGRAMKKMELAKAVCGSEDYGNYLYRPGGLMELREKGLVDLKRGVGFFRPDRPPPGGIVRTG